MPVAPTLVDILRADALDDIPGDTFGDDPNGSDDEAGAAAVEGDLVPEGACAQVYCEQCQEDFCEVCAGMIHRTGGRKRHVLKSLCVDDGEPDQQPQLDETERKEQGAGKDEEELDEEMSEGAVAAAGDASVETGAMGVSFSAQSG
ncbi:hypothetical protein GGI00_005890, partial [Coemansia sp. RSA 2681]